MYKIVHCTELYSTIHKLKSLKHSHGKWRTYFVCLKISSRENSHTRHITGLLWGRRALLVGNNICLLKRQHVSFPPISSLDVTCTVRVRSSRKLNVVSECRMSESRPELFPQGADLSPLPQSTVKAGRNHLNK